MLTQNWWIVFSLTWSLASTGCPPGYYFEYMKGCQSCDYLCFSPYTQDQCDDLCNGGLVIDGGDRGGGSKEKTALSDESSASSSRVPTTLVWSLVCTFVLLGVVIGGFVLYKYTSIGEYHVTSQRDVESQSEHETTFSITGESIDLLEPITDTGSCQTDIETTESSSVNETTNCTVLLEADEPATALISAAVYETASDDDTSQPVVFDLRTQSNPNQDEETQDITNHHNSIETDEEVNTEIEEAAGIITCPYCAMKQQYLLDKSTSTTSLPRGTDVNVSPSMEVQDSQAIAQASPDRLLYWIDQAAEVCAYSQEAVNVGNSSLVLPRGRSLALANVHCRCTRQNTTDASTQGQSLIDPAALNITMVRGHDESSSVTSDEINIDGISLESEETQE